MSNRPLVILVRTALAVTVALVLMLGATPSPVAASDGRINNVPWVNSWGAVVVYCVNSAGNPTNSYAGGGIKVLDDKGTKLLYASESAITTAQAIAAKNNKPALITSASRYQLYAISTDKFQINSIPDAEGKTFLGQWSGCNPINPGTQLCSISYTTVISITFVNNTSGPVNVNWVDYNCNEVFYNSLAPGEAYVQLSYTTHPWIIRDATTNAFLKEVVFDSAGSYTVTVP